MNARTFSVGEVVAQPGEIATGYCEVDVDAGVLSLPFAVVNGAKPGPVLAITAGIHGGEYVPMLAARRFVESLDPSRIAGTIVVSLQSSPISFLERAAFVNPIDGKNLNRSFPGNSTGSATERLAHWLFTNVISRANYYVDCHCGDLPEHLEGFTGVVRDASGLVDERALAMANCFDVSRTLTTSTGGSTIAAASAAGVPSVLIELGHLGLRGEREVQGQFDGLRNVAAHLGFLTSEAPSSIEPHPIWDVKAGLESEHDGFWFPAVEPGDAVIEGGVLGEIQDAFGNTLSAPRSPVAGVFVYGLASLAVHRGDFLACIAAP